MSEKQKNSSMYKKLPTKCPSCSHNLEITVLKCPECETEVKGNYSMSRFSSLSKDDEEFLFSFLVSRGSLKEVQERLSISYPTARARLDKLLLHLELNESIPEQENPMEMQEVKASGKSKVSEKKAMELLGELEKGTKNFDKIMEELGGKNDG